MLDLLRGRGGANQLLVQSAKGVSQASALLVPAARSITTQVQIVIDLYKLSALDLTPDTVRLQLQQLDLQTRGIRAADALHAATAIAFDADLLVSTDQALLTLDGVLGNRRGSKIICCDTDLALMFNVVGQRLIPPRTSPNERIVLLAQVAEMETERMAAAK